MIIEGASWQRLDMSYVNLSGSIINNAALENINLMGAQTTGLVLNDVVFTGIVDRESLNAIDPNLKLPRHKITLLDATYASRRIASPYTPFPIVMDINFTEEGPKIIELQHVGSDFGYAHVYGNIPSHGDKHTGIIPTLNFFYKTLTSVNLDSKTHPFLISQLCNNKALEGYFWEKSGLKKASPPQLRCILPLSEGLEKDVRDHLGEYPFYIIKPVSQSCGRGIRVVASHDLAQGLLEFSQDTLDQQPIFIVEPVMPSRPFVETDNPQKHGTIRRFMSVLPSEEGVSLAHHGRAYWKLAPENTSHPDLRQRFISKIEIPDRDDIANAAPVEPKEDEKIIDFIDTQVTQFLNYVLAQNPSDVILDLLDSASEADKVLGLIVLKDALSYQNTLYPEDIAENLNIDKIVKAIKLHGNRQSTFRDFINNFFMIKKTHF